MNSQNMPLPNYQDVLSAAKRLRGNSFTTPLLKSPVIDYLTGKDVWFKPECNQKVGAFKYRGAYNRLSVMSAAEKPRGVVAYSSGNHAQGVSRSAKELGISAVIIMPEDAPKVKVNGVLNDGATIVSYDRHTESREDIAAQISRKEGRIIVPSYDDAYIIAGQGTVGLEIAQEANEKGLSFDALISCMGGGGLCAGIGLALKQLSPHTEIHGAEPYGYHDHQMSLRAGRRVALDNPPDSICDALMTPMPGELTWQINKENLTAVHSAKDRDCLMAMAIAKRELGVTLEPGGAVAMAALLQGAFQAKPKIKTICVVLTGGNVDPEMSLRADSLLGS